LEIRNTCIYTVYSFSHIPGIIFDKCACSHHITTQLQPPPSLPCSVGTATLLCSLRVAPLLSSADARSKLALLSFLCSSLALARQTYVSASEYAPCPISLHDLLEPRVYRQRLGLQPKGRREQTREQSKCRRRRRFEDDLSWHG